MTPGIFSRPPRRFPNDAELRARDEKIESLKAVVGKLAHDFNNFLVPQFGYITLLKEEIPSGSTSAEYVARMEGAGRKTEGYIESILLGMRPQRQFSPGEFSFSDLVRSTVEQWKAEIPAGTEMEVDLDLEPFIFVGDERHWRSAVLHLFSNARYALATGGRLEVGLHRRLLAGPEIIRLGLETEDVYQFVVRDNGFGMTPETAARAFEPFFTMRTQIKAPGLGLTIVHAVTQFHGGQVELQSVEGEGTTVTIWIPAQGVNARNRLGQAGGGGFRAEPQEKRKVLLIEEDPLINEVLRDWLGRFDFDVQVATHAEEAVKQFERKRGEWSLVIIETDLRGVRGEDIYTQLFPSNPVVAWIFLAGRRKPEFAPEVVNSDSIPLIMQKPVTLRAFAEVVRNACR